MKDIPEYLRGLYRLAREQGWEVTRTRGGHLRWSGPNGERAFTASTPGERVRDLNNVRMKLRRAGLRIERG